jgi:hypothetical protein
MRDSERTIEVRDMQGRREFLRVPFGYLIPRNGTYYVPVGLLQEAPVQQLALIELPQEGEYGTWRLWVRQEDLLPPLADTAERQSGVIRGLEDVVEPQALHSPQKTPRKGFSSGEGT